MATARPWRASRTASWTEAASVPGTRVLGGPPGTEAASVQDAVREARQGRAVAIAFPADPGAYALASLALSL
ncbi:MAG: hypothetical protein ACHP9Z_23085, partial [Streptosporangiales bacterium]